MQLHHRSQECNPYQLAGCYDAAWVLQERVLTLQIIFGVIQGTPHPHDEGPRPAFPWTSQYWGRGGLGMRICDEGNI